MATRYEYRNRQAELDADKGERQSFMAELRGEPLVPNVLDLGLDLGRVEPVALKEESPLMVSAPPSNSGSPGGLRPRGKVSLSKEEADFAVNHCGISVEEYARQKLKHQHLKTIDPDRYGGTG